MIKNIFLIDADKFFANSFLKNLEKKGKYNLQYFQSFENAHEAMSQINPDLILLEHKLRGGKSGLDCIPFIKTISPDSEIVMVSDQNDISVVEAAYAAGVVKYFRKDILLLDHVEGLIRERSGTDSPGWRRLFANS